jgi:hypothetical protein
VVRQSNFVNLDITGGSGVIIDPAGALAPTENQSSAFDDSGNLKEGYNRVYMFGDSQSFSVVRASASNKWRLKEDLRSSLGLEFRVQAPVINVPFRLIMAYNPYAEMQSQYYVQKKTVLRFSVGRTF